jgi:hypothetical protein
MAPRCPHVPAAIHVLKQKSGLVAACSCQGCGVSRHSEWDHIGALAQTGWGGAGPREMPALNLGVWT